MSETADSPHATPPPAGVLAAFDELLKWPERAVARSRDARTSPPRRFTAHMIAGGLALIAIYGASAGFFQGGTQIAVAALKAPLIVFASVLLCVPSLYVFSALAGAHVDGRAFLDSISGFAALLGLVLLGLVPISWLFAVSSRSLLFTTWLQTIAWLVAVIFAWRYLTLGLSDDSGGKGALSLWLVLFVAVSLQVATYLRPVLWRDANGPIFEPGKRFFTEQLGAAASHDDEAEKARAKAEKAAENAEPK